MQCGSSLQFLNPLNHFKLKPNLGITVQLHSFNAENCCYTLDNQSTTLMAAEPVVADLHRVRLRDPLPTQDRYGIDMKAARAHNKLNWKHYIST